MSHFNSSARFRWGSWIMGGLFLVLGILHGGDLLELSLGGTMVAIHFLPKAFYPLGAGLVALWILVGLLTGKLVAFLFALGFLLMLMAVNRKILEEREELKKEKRKQKKGK